MTFFFTQNLEVYNGLDLKVWISQLKNTWNLKLLSFFFLEPKSNIYEQKKECITIFYICVIIEQIVII